MSFLALHALQDLIHFFPEEENKEKSQEIIELKAKIKVKSRKMWSNTFFKETYFLETLTAHTLNSGIFA